ncbi:MAG: thioredoxin domain-containing protein [Bacteroidales bacterium]
MLRKYVLALFLGSLAVTGCGSNGSEPTGNETEKETSAIVADSKKSSEGYTIQLTKAEFLEKVMNYEANPEEWIYEGDRPALIDFYADWCGPCKIASPILEELAEEYDGQIYVYKIDTEVERELASVFGIRSIPSFLFVPEKGKPTMSNGIARTPEETKKMFSQMIDEILLGKSSSETL